ncbi:MAG: hypothetical protein K2N80_15350 [Lachnospiraceae bacterium]|nr:hypothetical protein [Lachnospiraceae bacterium]
MKKEKVQENYQKIIAVAEKCGARMSAAVNGISMRKMAAGAAVLLVLSLIPLLVLGRYNVMCIDDYNYGIRVHDIWMETGSLWQSIQTALRQTKDFFVEWQGTYVSCFLMAVCPMNFRYEAAFIVPVIMIGMFAVSAFLFGRHILVKWLGSDKQTASFVMFLLLFMFYQVMEAPFEGIYWYNGATHYILMESLLFLMLTLVSGILWEGSRKAALFRCLPAVLLGLIVGGGNLVTALQAEVTLAFLLVYSYGKKRSRTLYVLLPFLAFSAGFLCNILAPGNAARSSLDTDVGYSSVLAVILSFYYAVVFMIGWTNAFVLFLWSALLPVFWKIGKKSERSFAHPVWVTAGAFCILSAMFTPTLYAVGMVGLSRVDNIIQMVYYLCLFFVTVYWFGWLSHRDVESSAGAAFGTFLEKTGNGLTSAGILFVLLMWVLTADKNTYTGISALRSLVNGDATVYYEEAMERHALYVDETVTDVVVKPFSARPALFDFEDLTPDEDNWLNLAVADYYHKNSVRRE